MSVLYTITHSTLLTIHHSYLEEARDEDERGSHQDRDELLGVDPRQQRHQVDEQEAAADVGTHEDGAGQGHGLALHRTNLAHLPVVGRGVNQRVQCALRAGSRPPGRSRRWQAGRCCASR